MSIESKSSEARGRLQKKTMQVLKPECCLATASDERMSCLESVEDNGSLGPAVGQAVEHLELVY